MTQTRFLVKHVSVNTLMCVSDFLPSVLVSVHTCNHRAYKDMNSACHASHGACPGTYPPPLRTHTPLWNVLAGIPMRCPRAHHTVAPPVHAHTLTHTDTHALSRAHRPPCASGLGLKTQAQPEGAPHPSTVGRSHPRSRVTRVTSNPPHHWQVQTSMPLIPFRTRWRVSGRRAWFLKQQERSESHRHHSHSS